MASFIGYQLHISKADQKSLPIIKELQGVLVSRMNPGGSDGKVSACNAGDLGSIPGSGRSPGGGNGNPLQYSYQENSMD